MRIFALVALLWAGQAYAIVEISEQNGRFQLTADNESARTVMDALAERFEFTVVYPSGDWGRERRDFERSGSLDDLLEYVLTGTNFVASYWRPKGSDVESVTRVEIIGRLAPGQRIVPDPVAIVEDAAPEPQASPRSPSAAQQPDDRVVDDTFDQSFTDSYDSTFDDRQSSEPEDDDGDSPQGVASGNRVTDMLRARAQPGRPVASSTSSATATGTATPAPSTNAPITGDQQAQLRELTQRAHAGVKDLAEALRRAESQTKTGNGG